MKFYQEVIQEKIGTFFCPQGQCGQVTETMVATLLDWDVVLNQEVRCSTLIEVRNRIEQLIKKVGLVIIWPSSGFYDKEFTIPAWHCYIVYNINPIKSFAAWENGVCFYDEDETIAKIEETLNSERHSNIITIHQYIREIKLLTIEKEKFETMFVKGKRRMDLYEMFLKEFEIIKEHCYAYQILFLGSFVNLSDFKEKPGDIDVYLRAFVTNEVAQKLPRNKKSDFQILPFTDFDNYVDIFPIEPIVNDIPELWDCKKMISYFNDRNDFNVAFGVEVIDFQKKLQAC